MVISFSYREGSVIVKTFEINNKYVNRTFNLSDDVYNKTSTGMREIRYAERAKRLEKDMDLSGIDSRIGSALSEVGTSLSTLVLKGTATAIQGKIAS